MAAEFQVAGANANALFTLKVHRGDGMALLAMNWKHDTPPDDFVGFAIEYREPDGDRFYPLKNRLAFPTAGGALNPNQLSTLQSPIQKFRWVHFPRNADLARRLHLSGDAGVHGRRRRARLRRDADGRDRAAPRDLSRPAERRLHARLRRFAGVRRPLRVGRARSRPSAAERRRGPGLRADPSRGGEGARLDGLRGAAGASSTSSTRRSPTTRRRSA